MGIVYISRVYWVSTSTIEFHYKFFFFVYLNKNYSNFTHDVFSDCFIISLCHTINISSHKHFSKCYLRNRFLLLEISFHKNM